MTRYAAYHDTALGHGQSVPLEYLELGYRAARSIEIEEVASRDRHVFVAWVTTTIAEVSR